MTPKPRRPLASVLYRGLQPPDLGTHVVKGNEEAFAALYEQTREQVLAVCRRFLAPTGDYEAVAADTFTTLWLKREKVRHPERIEGWLMKTAFNLSMKQLRRDRRALGPEVLKGWWETIGAQRQAGLQPDAGEGELAAQIREAIDRMPGKYARAIRARMAGIPDAQAAESLGLPVATFRTHLHKGLARLRNGLPGRSTFLGALVAVGVTATARARAVFAAFVKSRVAWVGMILLAVLAGWVWREVNQSAEPPVAPAVIAVASAETLPEKNLRLFRAEVLGELPTAARGLAFGNDGEAKVTAHDAAGSEVMFTLKITHKRGVGPVSWLKVRYCVEDRRLTVEADLLNRGEWKPVDPRRPIVLITKQSALGKLLGEIVIRPRSFEDIERLLARLPDDDRARGEVTRRYTTGPAAGPWPAGVFHVAGNDRWRYCVTGDRRLLFRRPADAARNSEWECLGRVPKEPGMIAATNDWLYVSDGERLQVCGADETPPRWRDAGPLPAETRYESIHRNGLGGTGRWVVCWKTVEGVRANKVWVRRATDGRAEWNPAPLGERVEAVADDQFVVINFDDSSRLRSRRIDEPSAGWREAGVRTPTGFGNPFMAGVGRGLAWWDIDEKLEYSRRLSAK